MFTPPPRGGSPRVPINTVLNVIPRVFRIYFQGVWGVTVTFLGKWGYSGQNLGTVHILREGVLTRVQVRPRFYRMHEITKNACFLVLELRGYFSEFSQDTGIPVFLIFRNFYILGTSYGKIFLKRRLRISTHIDKML